MGFKNLFEQKKDRYTLEKEQKEKESRERKQKEIEQQQKAIEKKQIAIQGFKQYHNQLIQQIPTNARKIKLDPWDWVPDYLTIYFNNDSFIFIRNPDFEMQKIQQGEYNSAEEAIKSYQDGLMGCFKEIKVKDILYFTLETNSYTSVETEGGGGGGSSLSGAIGGYLLAGEMGAIIGSRKKIDPIKTSTHVGQSTRTILSYYDRDINDNNILSFARKAYDQLMDIIPEKEYNYVMSQKVPKKAESGKSTKEKLIELKELLDDGLITKEEYETKRNEILNSI